MDLNRQDLEKQFCSSALTFERSALPDAEVEISLIFKDKNRLEILCWPLPPKEKSSSEKWEKVLAFFNLFPSSLWQTPSGLRPPVGPETLQVPWGLRFSKVSVLFLAKYREKSKSSSKAALLAEGQAGMLFPALVQEPDEFKVNISTEQFPSSQATSSS